MRLLLVAAVLLAGCAGAPGAVLGGGSFELVVTDGTSPLYIEVRLTNTGNGADQASAVRFKLTDAANTVIPLDTREMLAGSDYTFPMSPVTLEAGQSAEGVLMFQYPNEERPPWTLHYDGAPSVQLPIEATPP